MLGDRRTNKQIILDMVQKWPEDISFDQALYHMGVLQAIDEGLRDEDAGESRDHDEVFDELESLCDAEEHARLVHILRRVAERPAMFLGNEDPERAALWLDGFHAAIYVPTERQRRLYEQIMKSRGWKVTATSSWRQMLDRNLTNAEIIAELVEIEIEILNRMLGASASQA